MLDLDNTLADRQAAFDHWLDQLVAAYPELDGHRSWIAERDADGRRDRVTLLGELRRRFALKTDVRPGLGPYIDALVISGAVGLRKPDPAIFALAGEWCGTGLG